MLLYLKVRGDKKRRKDKDRGMNADVNNVTWWILRLFFSRTTGSPSSKSPAGGSGGPASGAAGATAAPGSGASNAGSAEPRTPTTGPQNKQLQNVKGEHPSVKPSKARLYFRRDDIAAINYDNEIISKTISQSPPYNLICHLRFRDGILFVTLCTVFLNDTLNILLVCVFLNFFVKLCHLKL